ncbi:MAG: histidine kinase, partial [Thiobacillus sp.]|nr:histidine kinase [Thiobacillus sp.]
MVWARWVCALALWLAGGLPLAACAAVPGVLLLKHAHFVLSDSATPPLTQGAPVSLPDAWMERRPAIARAAPTTGWYRLTFTSPSGSTLQAVYLPRLGLNAAVFVNGHSIGDGGRFVEPVGRNWNRPLLLPIPPGVLSPPGEPNRLDIRLLSHPYTQAYLDPVEVGPERVLRIRYETALFWRISLNQTASLVIAGVGLLMLTLWWQRRQDLAYAWFAAASLIWAAQSTNLYLRHAPFDTATWEILVNASFQVFAALLMAALLRFSNAGGRRLMPWLWGLAAASPAILFLVPAQGFMLASAALHGFTLLSALWVLVLLLRAAVRGRNRDAALLVAAMGVVVLFGAHDLFKHGQSRWFFEDVHLLHYSAPLIFLLVGLLMTSRFVTVLNQFEALNGTLETRVAAKQAELEASYRRMHALETERAVGEERERIYRDLHDDVGAKLLSLVYRAGTPEDASLARSALQDLRDVVSTVQPENLTLEALGADWRAECERRLS